jgi:hypothetical protein
MPKEELKTFSQILIEAMQRYDFNVEKLARLTGISERFLEALINENYKELPSAPYVRGYLREIGKLLSLNGDELWKVYLKGRTEIKSSGEKDKLPSNRFATSSPFWGRSTIIVLLLIIIIAGYLVVRGGSILGQPALEIIKPKQDSLVTNEADFLIQGKTDSFAILTLNGERIYPDKDGNFETKVRLQNGLNTFEFKVKKLLGRERVIVRQIIYQPLSQNSQ